MSFHQKGIVPLIILVVIVALAGIGVLGYQLYRSKIQSILSKTEQKGQTQSNRTTSRKTATPRSKAPGLITAAITAHGYNPKTEGAIKPDKYFSSKDRQIFLLLNVNRPKVGSHIEYIRYLQGRYLDYKSIKVSQPNFQHTYFAWTSRSGKEHKKGIYRVRLYFNGVLEKKVNYLVR